MKILVIMKRFGANKDMVMEDFGRQIRLFENLSKHHKIDFFCPDYVKKESKVLKRDRIKYIVKSLSLFSLGNFYNSLNSLIKKENYDIIVASTDPVIGIIGHHFSKKFKTPLVYELQDNFESYDSYKIPFVNYFDKKVIKNADMVIVVSESLKNYISIFRKKPIYIINNGIDLKLFKSIDKKTARKKLKLPPKSKIIIYIGQVEKLKGGKILIESFNKVKKKYPDTYLLLSGKIDKDIDIKQKNIIFRKFPKREEVVLGINASDVAVLPNPVNKFTEYCFPYKLMEYMACKVPIVATETGDVSLVLKKYKGSLCKPNNSEDLSQKIILKLKDNKKPNYKKDLKELEWKILSKKLDRIISNI